MYEPGYDDGSFSFPTKLLFSFFFFLLPVTSCFYDNSMICAGWGTLPVPRESTKSTLLNLL